MWNILHAVTVLNLRVRFYSIQGIAWSLFLRLIAEKKLFIVGLAACSSHTFKRKGARLWLGMFVLQTVWFVLGYLTPLNI